MSQPKVYEFAKEIGMETIALMDKIKAWKLPVKSHMASLDDDVIQQIKDNLAAESESTSKKKATKKKTAAKKTKAKKTAAKKKTVKKATTVVKKAIKVTKKEAATETGEEVAPKRVVRKKTVIRRKAADKEEAAAKAAEQEAIEAAEAAAEVAAQEAMETAVSTHAVDEVAQEASAHEEVAVSDEAVEAQAAESSESAVESEKEAPVATKKVRRNIVGKIDLSKVRSGQPKKAPAETQAKDKRPPRSPSQRAIRPGFVAPAPLEPVFEDSRFKKDERAPKKKVGAGAGQKVEEMQNFNAADFRKREVIFQPKKKRVALSKEAKKTQITMPKASKRVVKVHNSMKVFELAQNMGIKVPQLMKKLMQEGIMANMNTDLDFDTIALIATEFNFEAQNVHQSADELLENVAFGNLDAELVSRPPVVTVMGHVDHGKTTLLDSIRSANVVKGEAGGITQHIGAYKVSIDKDKTITFIDTPGHAAFTAMRERGANVTDIVIIVVAADDGVMPQTEEAINHAKAADVPIIVAVNKIDRPNANVEKIKQQLTEFELIPEEWGGSTIFCEVSALKKEGITELLEQVHLVAEILELKANPKQSGSGIVIESRMEKGRGNVATVLIQNGHVKIGQHFVAGAVAGKVRSLLNDQGKTIKEAFPGDPVELIGLSDTPSAGDRFDVCKDEKVTARLVEQRLSEKEKQAEPSSKMSLEDLFSKVKTGDLKELPVILKSDVAGTNEAIKSSFEKINTDEVKVKVIHSGVGGISESDILLASTSGGLVIGFNTRADSSAQRLAKEKGVDIKSYNIIYNLLDDIKLAMAGLLSPDIVEKAQGTAEVRDTFTVPRIGTIAGCFVTDGKINRADLLRLVRDGKVIFEGKVSSLKRFKDDVKEVASGYECGIGIENYNDLKVGDIIESYVQEEVAREL